MREILSDVEREIERDVERMSSGMHNREIV